MGWKEFSEIDLKFYPHLVQIFNVIQSRVGSVDVSLSVDNLANILPLLNERFGIYNEHLNSFEFYPKGESREHASILIHKDDNPRLTLNDKVSLPTLPCQILAMIIMFNILPKPGEFSKVRGCIILLIYGIMRGLPVNSLNYSLIILLLTILNIGTVGPKALDLVLMITKHI